jgi:inorganic pyrophosphatase
MACFGSIGCSIRPCITQATTGFIPQTLSEDGDALDALVIITDPTFTGCVIMAQPLGVLVMEDDKGTGREDYRRALP